jgi:hypothetical protein
VHVVKGKVVQQDAGCAGHQGLLQFFQILDLDLQRNPCVERTCGLQGGCNAARSGDVVFLDQDAVPKRHALVLPTAHAHRVFLRLAQAGQGLARVQNHAAARVGREAFDGLHVAPRDTGHGR